MPFKEATFWWGTIVGGTGIYFWVQGGERMTAGIILTIVGLLMSAYAVISHYKPQLPKLSMWVAGMVLTLAVLGYDIYDRHQVDSIPEFDAPQNQVRAWFGVVIDKCNITVNGQYLLAYKEKFEIAPACFVADGSVGLLDTPF